MRVRFSSEASVDLSELIRFGIETWGDDPTTAYVGRLDEALSRLKDHPRIGMTVDRRLPDLRRLSVGSHVIYYQPFETELLIVRVLHASRDVTRHIS